ncbi:hypothetical protein EA748_15740 [Acinetobacter ursingii]|uniref:hypothetical protein n=1 Tax=Acinetobacter ursingii TaxID=108980 RepID=UPI000F77F49C|nr:hypothetical protein [Acinetobacter ursingii]RSO80425.1 hypothetical protein EA748_15740 [Acinetobacter ursingii]
MLGKAASGNLDCTATSIPTSFPAHFTDVPDAIYYLTLQVTENQVTTTQTVSFNSDDQNTYTYQAIFQKLLKNAGLLYYGPKLNGWSNIYSMLNLDVDSNELSGFDSENPNWASQNRPIDILIIQTPENKLIGGSGLNAVDLYPMFKSSQVVVPTIIHSCGYGDYGSTSMS